MIDDEHVPDPDDNNVGAPIKMFSLLSKTRKRELLMPFLKSILQFCNDRSASFNEIMGSIGRLYMNGDGNSVDFSNMYDRISQNENPYISHKLSSDKALFLQENIHDLGRSNMSTLRNICGEEIIPSRYQLDKFKAELLPELGMYLLYNILYPL